MRRNSDSLLFPRNSNPYHRSWEDWAATWCNWLLSIPRDRNPSVDWSGENCSENQVDSHVWFLGGTFGNDRVVRRKCVIPNRKAILFPILIKEDSFAEDSDLQTEEELTCRAIRAMDTATILEASVDGIYLQNLTNYRVRSNLFDLNFPIKNVYDIVPCATRSVCDGYWVFLKPLHPGKHQIHFRGECSMAEGETPTERIKTDDVYSQVRKYVQKFHTFKVEVNYELTINSRN